MQGAMFNHRLPVQVLKAVACFALLVHLPMFAQTSRGTVVGTVTDISGSVIAGAQISFTNFYTGVVRTTVTNEVGIYRFDAVDLGAYTLKVIKAGFRPFISTEVGVEANLTTTINAKLEVGGVETAIQVNAEAAELLTKDGPLRGGNIVSREVRDLPLVSLDPLSLARTLPGAIELPSPIDIQKQGHRRFLSARE